MAISVSQGKTKSQKLKFFKSRYLAEFLHVIITFIGLKITFCHRLYGRCLKIESEKRVERDSYAYTQPIENRQKQSI